jgi:hypothetical protein
MKELNKAIVVGCDQFGFKVIIKPYLEDEKVMFSTMDFLSAVEYAETINHVLKVARESLLKIKAG